ncbi:Phage-related protein [Granulibacter bethesdensis]|nr:Phage-related protein [Granulibacter bethesdensis CGDNIH4]APH57396.1 Phage-related protein [Granulibacter bethesdensis]
MMIMAGNVYNYSPSNVYVVIGGVAISGFSSDKFITVDEQSAGFDSSVGADGEVMRSFSVDPRVKITLTLLQSSPSNEHLDALYTADRLSNGSIPVPILIEDLGGGLLFSAGTCWINGRAGHERSAKGSTRVWSITAVSPQLATAFRKS